MCKIHIVKQQKRVEYEWNILCIKCVSMMYVSDYFSPLPHMTTYILMHSFREI